ncbi:bacterial alpha-L-rhamnosidase 6 hairpin glycosidase domain-containing protein [Sarocladium implicatum]|nr:bacterial alpha-L-rhamnosidase 6 hairpin glycosidase domain-containing protein [Sarocladium implicatum]
MSPPNIKSLTFEQHHSGLGVGVSRPRISWQFNSDDDKSWVQTAYDVEIHMSSDPETEAKTYHFESPRSVLVPWPARPLASREIASVRVRVYGSSQNQEPVARPSAWSTVSKIEAALLEETAFKAKFITAASRTISDGPLRPLRFRKEFMIPADLHQVATARLYITAFGVYNVWINGKLASDELMGPGWTSYQHRLVYRTLDVSSMLVPGQTNAICAEVAEGWYAGRLGFAGGERFRYGNELALFAQLEVHGNVAGNKNQPFMVLTDDTWSTMPSAILSSGIYDGEVLDCASEIDLWTSASTAWPHEKTSVARTINYPLNKLVAPDAPPVRVTEQLPCQQIIKSKSGKTILDFGQNLVGKVLISRVKLGPGEKLVLRHAEVLEDGEIGTRPLRIAKCTDTLIGPTRGELKDWTPSFTFHGFRYVEVEGWPDGELSKGDISALFAHTDMRRRGFFECSNEAVNQLHRNVVASMRGNFFSIPTDCPQRDERLGWTGDIQAFCRTATFLYDTLGMLGSWLEDVSAEQLEADAGGAVPLVVPEAMPGNWRKEDRAQAIWGDVAVLGPKDLFAYSMDEGLLERQFQSMQAWLDQGVVRAPDGLWEPDLFQLGDWLDPNAPPDDPAQATTDNVLVANAYLVHVTLVFADICAALQKEDLAAKYKAHGENLRKLFQDRYITPDGNLVSLSQTGISLALRFNLFRDQDSQKQLAVQTLERLVRKAKFRISTGFAGTPVITHALTQIGRPQLAYAMLLQTECPGWLYPVMKHAATTIWERWDSMLPNGQINPGEMTSFNHYALGAVADWLHGSVAGISPEEPGWKVVRVRPVPGGNLTSAKASFDGPYGLVACEWTLAGSRFKMTITVPPNCTALVTLPSDLARDFKVADERKQTVGSGRHEFECEFIADQWPPSPVTHKFSSSPTTDIPYAE